MAEKDIVYDFKLWSELPSELRKKAVDIEGKPIDNSKISLTTLVCVESSSNPGSTPYVVTDPDPFALFNKRILEKGVKLDDFKKQLNLI